jgi:hypothetical protein
MVLFIRRFSKMMSKQNFFKGEKNDKFRLKAKRACYNYGKYDHYIANCPHKRRKKGMTRRRRRRRGATRKISITRGRPMVRHTLVRSGTPIVMVWPP